MFALTKREPVSEFTENQNSKRNNLVAKMVSKAVLAGSVMLATQLEAKEPDEEKPSSIDGVQTGSLGASENQTLLDQNQTFIEPDVVTGNTQTEVASIGNSSAGAISAGTTVTSTANRITSESGLPQDFVTQSPGVSDPAQITRAFPEEIETFAPRPVNFTAGGVSINQSPTIIEGIDGEDGTDGQNGVDGNDGADGRNGINGQDGIDWQDGINGVDGRDGINGQDGRDGIDGQDGQDGAQGENGRDGRDGINGQDGADGHDGIDGQDGADGRDGIDGQDGTDGQTVLLLDQSLINQPGVLEALNSLGINVFDGPLGTSAIVFPAEILPQVNAVLDDLIPDEGEVHLSPFSGSDQQDFLVGTAEDDVISSFGADDVLVGGSGADTLLGGDGNDTASYFTSNGAVNVNLGTNEHTGADATGDSLVSIENLVGSNFDDSLVGDNENNELSGGLGIDILSGGAGADLLHGGTGGDFLDGGTANDDVAVYFDSDAGISVSLANDTASGGHAEGDELDNIEFVDGSLFDDFIQGDEQGNRLGGLFGEDILLGEGGDDVLLGGNSADLIDGGSGIDTSDYTASLEGVSVNLETGESRFGEAEGDTLISIENLAGSAFDDTLTGDDGANRLTGRDGDDTLIGNGGNDRLVGGEGADHLDGGEGTRDAADYSAATEAVGVDLIGGGFTGEAEGDTFSGIEFVVGSDYHDTILADDGINRINGGDGCDVIFGRGGNDILLGEAGDDILNGGEGNDVFIFNEGDGNDIIEDFEAGLGRTDRVWLQDHEFEDFEDLQSNLVDTEEGSVLTVGDDSIIFQGVNSADFTADDFILT